MPLTEQHLTLSGVPAVLWSADPDAPLVLLAHGGGQSKLAPGIVARARRFAADHGFRAVALDAPWHGGRPIDDEGQRLISEFQAGGSPEPVNAAVAARAVPEWQAVIDELGHGGPVGFWGASLGGATGVELVAAEPRITAAVFGLVGDSPLASRITVPVEVVLQWDDELFPRASGMAFFDALGSTTKTLHLNPGPHAAMPRFEPDWSSAFFGRHLRPVDGAGPGVGSGT